MTSIGLRELTWMIEGAIQKIRKEHPFLSQLDTTGILVHGNVRVGCRQTVT